MDSYASRAFRDLAQIDELASQLLSQACITKPPVPANAIALFDATHPVILRFRPLGQIRAILAYDRRGWLVIVNSSLPQCAQRFSIFHEGFHILYRNGQFVCDGDEEYQEWLADAFAAHILMPRRWVAEIHRKVQEIRKLCGVFQVSPTAMTRRLNELSLGEKEMRGR